MALRFFFVPELLTTGDDGRPERRPAYVVESGCRQWVSQPIHLYSGIEL